MNVLNDIRGAIWSADDPATGAGGGGGAWWASAGAGGADTGGAMGSGAVDEKIQYIPINWLTLQANQIKPYRNIHRTIFLEELVVA